MQPCVLTVVGSLPCAPRTYVSRAEPLMSAAAHPATVHAGEGTSPNVAQSRGQTLALLTGYVTSRCPALSGSHPLPQQIRLSLASHHGTGRPVCRLGHPQQPRRRGVPAPGTREGR